MKKLLLSALFLTVSFSSLFSQQKPVVIQPTFDVTDPANRALYEQYIESHPFSTRPHLNKKQVKAIKKGDRPDQGWEQDFLRTMDPQLGRPAPERLISVYNQVAQYNNTQAGIPGSATVPWVERGPNNVGGRTRAIAFDPNDATNKKVWAGGVTGGLWYNNDITSASSQWIAVNDFWDNLAITAIAFDPNNSQIIYVGTGEGWGTGSSRGAGVWKSTNGGTSFSQLSATADFYYVNDIAVRNESGSSTLYVGISEFFYQGQYQGTAAYYQGLFRSTNGGTSFTQVMPNTGSSVSIHSPADIEIGANNRIWVGTRSNSYGNGGGKIYYSDNGTTWTLATDRGTNGRVALACAPSDGNTVYAVIESSGAVAEIIKTNNNGSTWTSSSSSSAITEPADADTGIPSGDFTRGQAWYDLVIAVSPSNASTIYVGGIDLFRSSNAGLTWSQISKWSNNNNLSGLSCPSVHADQHAFVFRPGATNEAIIGNDGGIYYASSLSGASSSSTAISGRKSNYNVTQYYACAISPTAGSNVFLAGAQDNGTQRYNAIGVNATTEVNGGDGAYCFIDQDNANLAISSYVYNTYDYSTDGGATFFTGLISDDATGSFINPADYDDNLNMLYSCKDVNTIYRISNLGASPTIATVTINGMSAKATNIKVSPFTTTSTNLFVGTSGGNLYRVASANLGTNPSVTNITGASFPSASISSIEFGATENDIIVTFFNYGVTSVWYSANGGTSWVSKEGNLPDMPVRWSLTNPSNSDEVILATEVGVWSTQNFLATSPTWVPSNSGLANVRVDMLQTRASDNEVIAATYGRGLFSSSFQSSSSLKNVTFQVDMHGVPSLTAVNVAGSFQSTAWTPGATTMTDANNDSIYDVTVQLAAGTYEYKFLKGGSWGLDETVPSACGVSNGSGGFNRQIVVVNDTTIPALCYSSCAACGIAATTYNVTFKVGMQGVAGIDSVNVAGNFQSPQWTAGATLMTDANNDSIWEVTVQLPAGIYEYKFLADGNWGVSENVPLGCAVNGNRGITITGDTVLPSVCYSTCNVCAPYVAPSISVSTAVTNATCFGTCDGALAATVSNGVGPLVYAWSTGASVASISNLCAGTYYVTVTDSLGNSVIDSLSITQPSAISVTVSTTITSVAGASDGVASVTVSGGTSPYTYMWSTTATTAAITNVAAGTYYVTITDANSCSITDSAVVLDGAPLATYNVTFRVGMQGVAGIDSVNVAGDFQSPQWTPGATLMTDANNDSIWEVTVQLPAGTYEYKFLADGYWGADETVPAGCAVNVANRGVTITGDTILPAVCYSSCSVCPPYVAPAISATASGTNPLCFGACDGSISVSVNNNIGPVTYYWSTGDTTTTNQLSNLCAGSYSVTVTDSLGNSVVDALSITQPSALSATVSTTITSVAGASDGVASVTVSGGTSPYTYMWSNTAITAAITNVAAGTYYVTITDANSCSIADSAVVQDGAPLATYNVTFRVGMQGVAGIDSVNVAGDFQSPQWTPGATLMTDVNNDSIWEVTVQLPAGTYEYKFLADGYWGADETVPAGCAVNVANRGVTITGDTILPAVCYGTCNVCAPSVAPFTITLSGVDQACSYLCNASVSAAITGNGPFSIQWINQASNVVVGTSSSVSGLCAGSYKVSVVDSSTMALLEDSITIGSPSAIQTTQAITNINCFGDSTGTIGLTTSGGYSPYTYAWTTGDTSATITGLAAGSYDYTVTDNNGCTYGNSITLTQPATPIQLTLVTANVTSFGGNDGYAKAVVSGGSAPYTYSWSNGAVTDSIGALYAGIYTICATDTLGCQICSNATIQAPQVTTYNVTFKVGVQGVSNVAGVNVVGTFQSPNWGIGNTLMTDANNDSIYEVTVQLPAGYYEYQFLSDISWSTQETVPMACGVFNGTNLYNRFFTVTGDTVLPAVCFGTCNVCAPYVQAFTVTASKTNVTCFGACDGTASVVANGASSSVSYNWTAIGTATSVGTSATVSGLCAGTYTVAVYDSVAMQTQLETVVISQPSLINPTFTITTTSAPGMPDGAIATSVTGGVAPYTYAWSNGLSTANLSNLVGGTYLLTVTDASGCQVVDTAVVANGTGPQVYAVTFRVGMSGVAGIDSVNVAGSFQNPAWAPGSTLMTDANNDSIWEVLVYLPADTFYYKFLADAFWGSDETVPAACGIDDGAGIYNRQVIVTGDTILPPVCFGTCNVCAPVYAPLQATIIADSISCFGTCDGELNVAVTGGSGMFVYQWKNITTNTIISAQAAVTNLCAGSYRVYINDTLALTTDSFDITLGQPTLLVTSNSSTNPTNNLTCDGNAGVVASGGSMPYAYTWSTGGSTSNLSALCNGTYTVTTTDSLGCFVIDTFVLTSPMVTVTVPTVLNDTICVGTTAILLASGATNGATYLWFADAAGNDTLISGATLSLSGLTSDSTVYVAIDSAGAFSTLVAVTAYVNAIPTLNLGNDVVTCASSYVIAAPTGFASYAWNNGGIASNDTALTSGNYSLTVTDTNGCSAIDTVQVTLNSALVATLNTVADVCIDAASFAVSGGLPTGGDYLVDGVALTVIDPSVLGVGVHTVSYIIADTCGADTATVSFQVNALPVVDLGNDTTICLGATITLSAPTGMQSYFWSTADTASSITVSMSSNYGVTVTDANGCSNSDLISVSVNQLLASNTTVENATCGLSNGTAAIAITPAGQTYSYNWSNAATSDSISGLAAGTYYVTATNTAGCSVSDSVVITNNGAIVLSTTLLDATCFGATDGSATVIATGGGSSYTYLWSNAVNTATNSGIAAGTYAVTVTSNTGCVESDNITINQSAAIALTGVIQDATCGANDGAAIVGATGGNSPFSYSWSNSATSDSITNVGAGCYSVTITDAQGCTADTTLCISNSGAGNTIATIYDVTCPGNTDGSAKVSMVGGVSPFTYNWSTIPAQTTDSVSGLTSGLYTVTVTDFTGCISIASVQVNTQFTAPSINLPANLVACSGQPTIITAPTAASYLWSFTNATTQSITTFSAGNYSVTITDANGCIATDSTTLTINQLPVVAQTNFSALCNNASNLALAGGTPTGGIYSGTGVNNGSFNPSAAGVGTFNITYTYTDANGCTNTIAKPITVNAAPTVSQAALNSLCVNNSAITLSGGTPTGGIYSGPGVSSGNFNPLVAGVGTHNIIYQYTNASGCSSTATQTITVNSSPTVTLAAFAGTCINTASVVLSGGSPSGGVYSGLGVTNGVFQPSIAGAGNHVITYSVTNAFGCSASANKTMVVNSLPSVSFASLNGVCANGSAFTLTGGFPTGGIYTGAGVVSNQFFPANAGLGNHILTYTYTNANGCVSSDTSQIAVLTLPVVVQAPIAGMCENANPVLLTGGSPTGGNYSGNGVSTGIFNPATAGVGNHTITYTYTDSYGCQGTAGTTITVGTLPSINFNPLGTVCFNAPTFQLTGATPLNGTYSGAGVTSNQFTAANAGVGVHTIAYTYTAATGCSNTVTNTITVNPLPSVTFAGALNVCQNDNQFPMQGGFPSGGIYSGTGISNGVFNPAAAGVGAHNAQYTYIDANGCSNYNTTTINVYALPSVQTSNDTSICVGEAVSMSASGGVYYVWSNGIVNASNTVSPVSTTTYIVTVTNLNGCTNTGDVKVTVVSSPVVNLGTDRSICEGDQTVLNAGPGFSQYLWQNGLTVQAITVNTSGQYYVTVKNSTGCVGSDTVSVVVRQNPVVNLGNDTLICTEVTPVYALSAGNGFASYNWNNGAWFLQSYNVTQSGTYSVEVKDNFGCVGSDAIVVTMEQCNVSVDEVFASNNIKVYPTPFTNTITLQAEHPFATNLLVSVMDVTGRMVHYTQLDAGNETLQLDLSNLPPGMYILKASNSIESQSFRVIKQ